jgi:Mn-dependent DtxR family transcriptional regulator
MVERESPTQDALLEFVRDYKQSNEADGNSPTYEEIAEALGVNRTTAYNTVLRLIKRGKLSVNNKGKIRLGGKYIPPE